LRIGNFVPLRILSLASSVSVPQTTVILKRSVPSGPEALRAGGWAGGLKQSVSGVIVKRQCSLSKQSERKIVSDFTFPFEKLEVWQLAIDFADFILNILESFPTNKYLRLIGQMEAAVSSIAQNISGSAP
jgi:hypothetical protein